MPIKKIFLPLHLPLSLPVFLLFINQEGKKRIAITAMPSAGGDDLNLLLSLRDDRVPETPPGSPSSRLESSLKSSGRVPDNGMSVFRDAVKDYLDLETESIDPAPSKPTSKTGRSDEIEVEKFSGLRIRKAFMSSVEIANKFSDIRFIRLQAIRNMLAGDTLSGCWATVGVLTENGERRVSSNGKDYCIWKISCLDESDVSVFLFGDAYTRNCKESTGAVFAFFNATVRKESMGKGFSLSVFSDGQMIKMGTSSDYGTCKGKRKDGMACKMAVNKHQRAFCKFHTSNASQNTTVRAELKGGNFSNAFKPNREGLYMVDPQKSSLKNPKQKAKVMSIDGLRKALSSADRVTTNHNSQGIRFLTQVTASKESKTTIRASAQPNQAKRVSNKRPLSEKARPEASSQNKQPPMKLQKTYNASKEMIELELVSSDEEY